MKKDLSNAIADYKKALDLDPQNSIVRDNLGRVQNPKLKKN
jgi:Flp pilus assembly protein TadD